MEAEGCGRGQEDSPATPSEAKSFPRGQQWPKRAHGKGHLLQWCLLLPPPPSLSLGQGPKGRDLFCPLPGKRKYWGEEELTCQPHGPWWTPGPLTGLQGYLQWPTLAPRVPLNPGRPCSFSSQPLH